MTDPQSDQDAPTDPTTQYRLPDDQSAQKIPHPGPTDLMQEQPDHGETSYRAAESWSASGPSLPGPTPGSAAPWRSHSPARGRYRADLSTRGGADAAQVVALIEKAGQKGVPDPGDIADESLLRQARGDGVEKLGGLDILVNVAGYMVAQEKIEELTTEQFDRTFKINVYALFWICKAAVPHMKPGRRSSTRRRSRPTSRRGACSTTPRPRRPTSPSPRLWRSNWPGEASGSTSSLPGRSGRRFSLPATIRPRSRPPWEACPLEGPGQPAELAPVYVLLASQESSYITGENFGVTGGTPLS